MSRVRSDRPPPRKPPPTPSQAKSTRRWTRRALWLFAAASALAVLFVPRAGYPIDETAEITVELPLVLLATALALLALLGPNGAEPAPRRAGGALSFAALLALGVYVNFGAFHGRTAIHHWELFHYALGAKYFPELGYDGLYAASVEAQRESRPQRPLPPFVRDLRTNEVVPTASPEALAHRLEVRSRFEAERWRTFVADHDTFLDANTDSYLAAIRRDHGYNPTPAWTALARLFAGWPRLDLETLGWLALLDPLLLGLLFWSLYRTFGGRTAALALVLFGLGYAGRYFWVGGALLREDWLVASVLGICMLERRRFAAAGALFGWATAVRVFPVLFLFGPALLALRGWRRRESLAWALRLGAGFVVTLLLAGTAGSLTGRGPAAWSEFARSIQLHRTTWLTNNVGLDDVLLYDLETMERRLVDFSQPEPWLRWQAKMNELAARRRPLLLGAKAAVLALLAAACWRLGPDPTRAAVLGMVAIFALTLTTCYYWQMLLLAPLLGTGVAVALLALNAGLYGLHLLTPAFEMRYGLFSWGLLLVFAAVVWRTLRRAPSPDPAADSRRSAAPRRSRSS